MVANAIGLAPDQGSVQATRLGGGFGRRLMSDYAAEAAVVSRAVDRRVQVIWTREDDIQHDYYRPASVHYVRAGLDEGGRLVGWDHHLVSVSRNAYRLDSNPPETTEVYGLLMGAASTPADMEPDLVPTRIPHCRLRYTLAKSVVPVGAWRAPAHCANAFVIETLIDELARSSRQDPIAFRAPLLGIASDMPVNPERPTARLIRNDEAPPVEVHIVPSRERPGGFGEIALPPIAPAVAKAIFAATGERIRRPLLARLGYSLSRPVAT